MQTKQVPRDHYSFSVYMDSRRWHSLWIQLKKISELAPARVLEIGPGAGILKSVAKVSGIEITTVDHDLELNPDYVGSLQRLPFSDASYDLVCAFQVLEHLEYQKAIDAVLEMARVSAKHIFISLPNAQITWRYQLYLPKFGELRFMFPRPLWRPTKHRYDGEHYWEINKKGYELKKILKDLNAACPIKKEWRPYENPYHHFILMEKP